MVGRFDDQNKIEKTINSINEGLIWLTGSAGIGKSFLSARLMRDLEENNKTQINWCYLIQIQDW